VEEENVIKAFKFNITIHNKGHASSIPHDQVLHMLQFYEQLHECGIPVSSQVLARELQRISPQLNNADVAALCRQVLRIMKKNNVTHYCITHEAQNIHYEQHIIDDFIFYVNWQIVMGKYSSDVIINMDETNVNFDPSPRTTLFWIR
jgi:hypothetical protein